MSFVVHENFGVHRYTRIHRSSCRCAKPAGRVTKNTRWHPREGGFYLTHDEAHAVAKATGQSGPWDCKVCKPERVTRG